MNRMFVGASSFNGNVSGWDTSSVTNMNHMFFRASSFNGNVSGWDTSSVTNMNSMFDGASSFNQNLGEWYVVPDRSEIERSSVPGIVGTISAQNPFLDGQNPAYGIGVGGDPNFEIVNGNRLNMTSVGGETAYAVNVTASGSGVFEDGNNWRMLEITVSDTLPAGAFVTTWDAGPGQHRISIPMEVHSGGTLAIDWGDGSTSTVTSDRTASHTYSSPGKYRVSMTGDLSRINLGDSDATSAKLVSIDQWGDIGWASMENAFSGASNMVYKATDSPDLSGVTSTRYMFAEASSFNGDISSWNVSPVVDMGYMFFDTATFNRPLNSWNVSSATNMVAMFHSAVAFDQPLNSWNVSSATYMSSMFFGAVAFNGDISKWNTSSVTEMNSMFIRAVSFNGDISSWNVSSATNMNNMFDGASSFNKPLNSWDVSGVTDMGSMFSGAADFNQPLDNWNVSSVIRMNSMFNGATAFDQNLGEWYVVSDRSEIGRSSVPGIVGTISAQNPFLDGQNLAYGIGVGGDPNFEIVNGNGLSMTSVGTKSAYAVNVTASGSGVFEDGNNWRMLKITVSDTLPAGAFVTTWDAGPGQHRISIPMDVHSGGTLTIHWGDGSTSATTSNGTTSHTYSDSGEYQVSMTGDLSRINLGDSDATAAKLVSIDQWGDIGWASMENAFRGASNMVYKATDSPDLSGVTSTRYMFASSSFNGDISSWNVSPVVDMSSMFRSAAFFDQPLDSWNVSRVADMKFMFSGATFFDQPLNSWNVSRVADMGYMFNAVFAFDQPLNSWNVSRVADMEYMFSGAISFDQSLNSWNVSRVADMKHMFSGATSFNKPLNSWDVSGVTDMGSMFSGAVDFNQPLDNWNVSSVIRMNSMFNGATAFDQNLGEWYVVPDRSEIWRPSVPGIVGTISAQNLLLDGQNPAYGIGVGGDPNFEIVNGNRLNMTSVGGETAYAVNVTASGSGVFEDGNNWRMLEITVSDTPPAGVFVTTWDAGPGQHRISIPLEVHSGGTLTIHWGDGETSTVTSSDTQSHAYSGPGEYQVSMTGDLSSINLGTTAPKLASIDQWGDIRWASMANAFRGASNMVHKATDAPDLSGVTSMSRMFHSASKFNGDLSGWNVSSVTDTSGVFLRASSFNGDVSTWDVSAVTDMSSMFDGATVFDRPLNSWNVSSVTHMISMFSGAAVFNHPLNSWNVSSVINMDNMFDGADSFEQNLGEWYVVLDGDAIYDAAEALEIRAQNQFLDGQNPAYGLGSGGDSDKFEISGDSLGINPAMDYSAKTSYHVNITSTGLFGTDNWRMVAGIMVDGIMVVVMPLEIVSVDAVSQRMINITFTESVTGSTAGMTMTNTTNPIMISSAQIEGSSVLLTLDGDILGPDRPVFQYDPDAGDILDGVGKELLGFNETITTSGIDNNPPVILNATIFDILASTPSITVTFSEDVYADPNIMWWRISGPDARNSVAPSSHSDPNGVEDTMTLQFSNPAFFLRPANANLTLEYAIPGAEESGHVWDDAQNLLTNHTVTVLDKVSPRYVSSDIVSATSILVAFTEAVVGGSDGFVVHGSARNATVVGTTTEGHTITLDLSDPILSSDALVGISYSSSRGNVADAAGNALDGFDYRSILQRSGISPPTVTSAKMLTTDTITVGFSEAIYGDADTNPWRVGGRDADALGLGIGSVMIPEGGSSTVTILLTGNLTDTAPRLTIAYDSSMGSITDDLENPLDDFQMSVADAMPPMVRSVTATSAHQIKIFFTEAVTVVDGGFDISGTTNSILVVQRPFHDTDADYALTLELIGDILGPDNPTLSFDADIGTVQDANVNVMPSFQGTSIGKGGIDTTPPSMLSATAVTADSIVVKASEELTVIPYKEDPAGWSLAGSDAGSLSVAGMSAFSDGITLVLSGDLPDTAPDLSITYESAAGDVVDTASNPLTGGTLAVGDGLKPEALTFSLISPTEIEVAFSENVTGSTAGFTVVRGTDTHAPVQEEMDGSSVTLSIPGGMLDIGTAFVSYDQEQDGVTDSASNQLASFAGRFVQGTAPDNTSPTLVRATVVASSQIDVLFSEPIRYDASDVSAWGLAGRDAGGIVVQSSEHSQNSDTVTLFLSDSLSGTMPSLSLVYTRPPDGGITDLALNHLANFHQPVSDGLPPEITEVRATTRTKISIAFTEPVTGNLTGWAAYSDGSELGVQSISSSSSTANLTLTSVFSNGAEVRLAYDHTAGDMKDDNGNFMGTHDRIVDTSQVDFIPPTITAAEIVRPQEIKVTFSEYVTAADTNGNGWSIFSPYEESFNVINNTNPGRNVMRLNFSGTIPNTAPDLTLTYDASGGAIQDNSNNTLATATVPVSDGLEPMVEQASLLSPRLLLIRFTESVSGSIRDNFSIENTATAVSISGPESIFDTDEVRSRLSPPVPASDLPTLKYSIFSAPINDGKLLMSNFDDLAIDRTNYDDQPPVILHANATSLSTIDVQFTESVTQHEGSDSDWTLFGPDASGLSVVSINDDDDMDQFLQIVLSGNLPNTGPDLTLQYSESSEKITDVVLNPLASVNAAVADSIRPELISATALSTGLIELVFTETVDTDSTDGTGWSLGGTDAGSLTVSSNTDPGDSSRTMDLTLSGDMPDTDPNLTLIYTPPLSGGVTDGTNSMTSATVTVSDGIPPAPVSAKVTAPASVQITLSEAVTIISARPGDFAVSGVASNATVIWVSASGNILTLTLSDSMTNVDSPALSYGRTSGSVQDDSSNALADFAGMPVDTSADITPPKIESATAVSLDTITVTFDESVDADSTDGTGWFIAGADAVSMTGPLTVSSNTDPGDSSRTMNLTLSGDMPDTDPNLTLIYTPPLSGGVTDGSNQLGFVTVVVDDGIAPAVKSITALTSSSITLEMSEVVTSMGVGPGGFLVSADSGAVPSVSSITVSGSTATLALSAQLPGHAISLEYDQTAGNVTDSAGNPLASFAGHSVDVQANLAPTVDAGGDQTVPEGSTVSLDATVSDPDSEDTLEYTWSHNSTALAITLANSAALDTSFAAPNVAGDTPVEFTLEVSDGTATVTDKVTVTITDSENTAPTVDAGGDQTVPEGSTVSLDATVSDPDSEDTLEYTWSHDSTLSITFADDAEDPSFTAPNVAEDTPVEFTLEVSDGTATVTDKVTVTITDSENTAPTVDAGGDQTVPEGSTVNLDGTATDLDSEDTLEYTWSHDSTLSITFADDAEDPSFTAPNVAEDTPVEFTLEVSDGTATVTDKVTVTITDSANTAPEVNAGPDQTVPEGSTVNLDGTATDLDSEDTLSTPGRTTPLPWPSPLPTRPRLTPPLPRPTWPGTPR